MTTAGPVSITVATETAADVANKIHQHAKTIRDLLHTITRAAGQASDTMECGYSASNSISGVVSQAARLAEETTKVDTLLSIALEIGLTKDQVQAAYNGTDRVWFHTAR